MIVGITGDSSDLCDLYSGVGVRVLGIDDNSSIHVT